MRANTTREPARAPYVQRAWPLKLALFICALVLVPPFALLAIAPMLLLSLPVAIIGLPFLVSALLRGSLKACSEERRRHERQCLTHHRAAI